MAKLALNMTWTIKNDREDLEKLYRILRSEDLDEQGLTWLKEKHSKRLEDKLITRNFSKLIMLNPNSREILLRIR